MWFDASAALADLGIGQENGTRPIATTATSATPAQRTAPNVAEVASVATPPAGNQKPDHSRHGASVAGHPLIWTGRVVSLDEWRRLSEWGRHGSTGKVWDGLARQWEENHKS